MLIKNKFYYIVMIILLLADIFILSDKNLITTDVGQRIFYSILTIIFIMILLGKKKK